MLRAWKNRRRLRNHDAAVVWLFRIATNLWRDRCRRSASAPVAEAAWENVADSSQVSAENSEMNKEHLRLTLAALDELPDRQRTVLYLQACEGLAVNEIADVLGIAPAAVKSSAHAGRKKLREQLKEIMSASKE
jgi:RNA polymerase sigma-70 factor (ECF subfamily)